MEKIIDYVAVDNSFKSEYSLENLVPNDKDIEEMCSLIDTKVSLEVLRKYNRGIATPKEVLKLLLRRWAISKYPFYVLFGRKLSFSYKSDMAVSSDEIMEKIEEFLSNDTVELGNGENKKIYDTSHFVYYRPIIKLFDEKDIISNICPDNDEIKHLISEYKPKQKLSKFFSKFFDDKIFDIEYSKVLQTKERKEVIFLSIDFNDYLTSSINNNGWSTCFTPGGMHDSAVLEPAFDCSTIVSFISNDTFYIGNKWNSKSIRSYCHIDRKTCAFAISRAYPNCDNTAFYDAVKLTIEKMMETYWEREFLWYVDLVTKSLDKTDCHETYELINHLYRVHKNSNKNYLVTSSSIYFLDPIKYFVSPTTKITGKIEVALPEPICSVCGNPVEQYSNNMYCRKCYDEMAW